MERKDHWENIYQSKSVKEVSWFQEHADLSLNFIKKANGNLDANIIDVGGGASVLVDNLIANGYRNITVVDISEHALSIARERIGEQATNISWVAGDVTTIIFPKHHFDIWHDRAVFHFLTDPADRQRYVENMINFVKPGGHVIVATFSLNGPTKCSGLDIIQYSPEKLQNEFGEGFSIVNHVEEKHKTPSGGEQQFIYCSFVKN